MRRKQGENVHRADLSHVSRGMWEFYRLCEFEAAWQLGQEAIGRNWLATRDEATWRRRWLGEYQHQQMKLMLWKRAATGA